VAFKAEFACSIHAACAQTGIMQGYKAAVLRVHRLNHSLSILHPFSYLSPFLAQLQSFVPFFNHLPLTYRYEA
jgi:hypothetical protein